MAWLLIAVFIVVPLLEIFAFIQVGSAIGALPTLALIVLTAVVGALLVRRQGLKVVLDARDSLARDELPLAAAVHGGLLLLAGLLLLTPGFVTDSVGFLLLVPAVRSRVATRILRWLEARTKVGARSAPGRGRRPAVIEGEAVEVERYSQLRGHASEQPPWTSRDGTNG
ncbi:MAG TPA: FxsA family protein [Aestuariivirgaceae bacterium]|nr:FxsA family protein [Aestuariivirgaceae bacterium]